MSSIPLTSTMKAVARLPWIWSFVAAFVAWAIAVAAPPVSAAGR